MKTLKTAGFFIILCSLLTLNPLITQADVPEDVYTTLEQMTLAMNEFSDSMESDPGLEAMPEIVEKLAETIEAIGKEMVTIYKDHQQLFMSPPGEAEKIIAEHQEALTRYEEALQQAVRFANDNMDEEEFQASFERLNRAIYDMYR